MKKLLMWCLVMFCSCGYTQIHDPLRLPEPEPVKLEPIIDYHDGLIPQVRRDYYGRFSHTSYYNSHYPYIYSGYYQPPARIIYVEAKPVTQAQPYRVPEASQPVAKVMEPPTQKDIAKAAKVWQRRVSPRSRRTPTPTAR